MMRVVTIIMLVAKPNFQITISLHLNVNRFVSQSNGRVKFNYREVPTLEEYTPFSENIDIEGRIRPFCGIQDINNYSIENENDQDEYIVKSNYEKI